MNLLKRIIWHRCFRFLLVVIPVGILVGSISCNPTRQSKVLIRTEMGEIEVEIYPDQAPLTASNFLSLVERGVYTNAIFYRVVRMDNQPKSKEKIEVIQGGLYNDSLVNQYPSIEHETTEATGIKHDNGVISMARNKPGTASTEFFICIGDQSSLDFGGKRNSDGQGFAAFGKVINGMEVVRAIQALPDDGQYLQKQVQIREMQVIR